MSSFGPVSSMAVSAAPLYVPPVTPPIDLYKDSAEVDVVYLVEVTPFIPSGS